MEKERLKFCIERFDHYYDSINNKSAVFLGLGTFVGGGLVAIYPYLRKHVNCTDALLIWLSISFALAFLAVIIVIIASTPFLSKDKDSMFYFNSIAAKKLDDFQSDSQSYSEESELFDLRNQVHGLASGLRRKFIRLRIAAILYTLMFLSMVPLVYLIMHNFKN